MEVVEVVEVEVVDCYWVGERKGFVLGHFDIRIDLMRRMRTFVSHCGGAVVVV